MAPEGPGLDQVAPEINGQLLFSRQLEGGAPLYLDEWRAFYYGSVQHVDGVAAAENLDGLRANIYGTFLSDTMLIQLEPTTVSVYSSVVFSLNSQTGDIQQMNSHPAVRHAGDVMWVEIAIGTPQIDDDNLSLNTVTVEIRFSYGFEWVIGFEIPGLGIPIGIARGDRGEVNTITTLKAKKGS